MYFRKLYERMELAVMFNNNFWIAASERAIKTFAQALLALIGTDMVGITSLDWPALLAASATATLLSVLSSVGSANFGKNPGPSLADETTEPKTTFIENVK
jgi:hypothetical protein